jgi:hypothetical protein
MSRLSHVGYMVIQRTARHSWFSLYGRDLSRLYYAFRGSTASSLKSTAEHSQLSAAHAAKTPLRSKHLAAILLSAQFIDTALASVR